MTYLVLGLAVFFAIHLVPSAPRLRAHLVTRMGENPYKGVFSLVSLAGVVLLAWGFSKAPFEPVYAPPTWGRHAAMLAVPVALILFAAANMPTHLRVAIRHPMMLGLALWAAAHLLANGDLRSIVLFGSFAGYAVVATVSAIARGKTLIGAKPPRWAMDAAAVVGGLVVAGVLMRFHAWLFGMPVLP